jgi:hypothetical protein
MPNKPTYAFSFELASGIVTFLFAILLLALFDISASQNSAAVAQVKYYQSLGYDIQAPSTSISGIFGVFAILGIYTPYVGIATGIMLIISSIFMHKPEIPHVRKWTKIASVCLLASLAGGMGFGLGFALGLAGIFLGFRYRG